MSNKWYVNWLLTFGSFSPIIALFLLVFNVPYIQIPIKFAHWVFQIKIVVVSVSSLVYSNLLLKLLFLVAKRRGKLESVGKIKGIRGLESEIIPVFVGLFVIVLGINYLNFKDSLSILMLLMLVWHFWEKQGYYNILWTVSGYHAYEVELELGVSIWILSKKKDIRKIESFENLLRLNNNTFLEG